MTTAGAAVTSGSEVDELIRYIHDDIIGRDVVFSGPFGMRKVLYCDYVASGKPVACIENFVRRHVLPMYGNTHTTTSVTSLQTTLFRQEARDIIRNAVRASEHDAVIFTGNGVTGAIHKLINALNFTKPPIVFCGPFEHHSSLLPWREIAAFVIQISESEDGSVNINHLIAALAQWISVDIPKIGCFSAASNITGKLTDTVTISSILHRYGALAVWDYATAAPYVEINMHPICSSGDASKDAIFISPHKFVGGVGTPGVLVAGKHLFRNPTPTDYGGGTVFFVSENDHKFLKDYEMREEGGTPDIVGAVRAGLAFKLKEDIGWKTIMERETLIYNRVLKAWGNVRNIEILGLSSQTLHTENKIGVFSFLIRHMQSGLYLHYSFVAALLNDLFGIQARGGCACAGPYAHSLLGISAKNVEKFESALVEDSRLDRRHLRRFKEYSPHEVLRPGFVRISLPYFLTDEEIEFVIKAVEIIAEFGWMLLPKYMFDPETGEWKHSEQKVFKERKWLGGAKFSAQGILYNQSSINNSGKGDVPITFSDCLARASKVVECAKVSSELFLPDHNDIFDKSVKDLKWFIYPSEAQTWLKILQGKNTHTPVKIQPSFIVRKRIEPLSEHGINEAVTITEEMRHKICAIGDQYTSQQDKVFSLVESNSIAPTTEDSVTCQLPGKDSISLPPVVKFVSPPKRLFKLTVEAIDEFQMIHNGDRVLVCLSGGKDSLTLLHVLRQYQFYAKKQNIAFELGAVTVDPKTASYDPTPLISYLAALDLPYFYEEQTIFDQALALPEVTSICAFCSRMKRGRLYHCARREGWNVLAMGQHLDDLAESFLMSVFQNGLLNTMKANYIVKEGDLRVIRPLVYVREKDTREFAENSSLPVIPENCPACFEAPKERHRMKQLLASQEIVHPKLFYSIKEALRPLMAKQRKGTEYGEANAKPGLPDFDDED